jgi:lipid II:glycine glycyltransferase (peptidoglycan interpeptide bridge formation enzyme)
MGKLYREVSNTVTKDEFNELRLAVLELAEAQKKTEQRVEELAQAQKRTEQRVEELAQAQKETERELKELAKGLKETRQMVGNLSDTVGYTLEDRAIKSLPDYLKQNHGIEVKGRLVRKFIKYNGKYDELNIFGEGKRKGKKVYILGEAKSRLSKKNVDKFLKLIKRLEKHKIITQNSFVFMVTYSATPESEEYARDRGIEIIWSYEV